MTVAPKSFADVLMPQKRIALLEHEEDSEEEQREEDEADEYSRGAPRLPWGITKRVIHEAPVPIWSEGYPKSGDKVSVHFVAKLQDGTQVGSSSESGKPFEFVIDERPREVVIGMELAALTMRRTEIAEFKVAPRFAYDDLGSPPVIPPGATMLFEVEMLSWVTQMDLFGDACAIKSVKTPGAGERKPERGQEVVISMKCTDRKGNVLEEHSHSHLEHIVGDPIFGALSRIVVTTLASMVEGERCSVVLTRDAVPTDRRYMRSTVDLELEHIFDSRDVSILQDRSIIKKVLQQGEGDVVPEGSKVKLRVESATDGVEPLYGFVGPKTLQLIVGDGEVCDALEFAAMEMRVGERAALTCRAASCVEIELGLVALTVPKIVFVVELLSVDGGCARGAAAAQSQADSLAWARRRKDAAAGLYRRQRYALALRSYTKILELAQGVSEDSEQAEEARELCLPCELNRAACFLKLSDFSAAKASCDKVLATNPDHVKALFRRASASLGLSDFSGSMRDLTQVLSMDPRNGEARALAVQVKEAQRSYTKASRETAARMIACQESPSSADAEPSEDAPEGLAVRALQQLAALSACLPVEPCMRLFRRLRR